MEDICIRFAGIDQNSGALLLQFSKPENLITIDQSTIHAFFPHQYETDDVDVLTKHMAQMGRMLLQQQQETQNINQFTQAQVDEYSKLVGSCRTVEVDSSIQALRPDYVGTTILETVNNPSGQFDQLRCVVLEILAEEGLIPGGIKLTA